MTTINTIEDLVRLLDEKPEWAEALRSRLQTRELTELPGKFESFRAEMHQAFADLAQTVGDLAQTVKGLVDAQALRGFGPKRAGLGRCPDGNK
jgi:hypothetical protein